jgi:hypothetical protein
MNLTMLDILSYGKTVVSNYDMGMRVRHVSRMKCFF